MIEHYDKVVLFLINGFVDTYWSFDRVVMLMERNRLFKGGFIVALYWCYWFSRKEKEVVIERRKIILASIIGILGAIMVSLAIATFLPIRIRPMYNPALHLNIPHSVAHLKDYSSFPSDTATVASGLAMGVFLISRKIGILVIVYVLTIVTIPRIYLGFHYPTDMIAGLLLGTSVVLLANVRVFRNILTNKLLEWSEKYTAIFYGLFFLITFQLGSLFLEMRDIGRVMWPIIKKIAQRIS